MKTLENLVVIHLSATAVYVVIGQVKASDDIRILGVGEVKNEDFQYGSIKHWDRLKSAIRQAIIEAEEMANCRVHSVWLTLSTPELLSKNSYGSVDVDSGTVETRHIVQALSTAKDKDMPPSHYLMHHCQQGIFVDEQEEMVDDAIDMLANKLTVMYHLMMMPVASRQNIQKLIQACDVSIDHILFDAVSSAEYALITEEREQGVCFIDIGASTTSVCVYRENRLVLTYCVSEGGNKATMDISADLGISMIEAEALKKRHGTVDVTSIDASQFVTVPRIGMTDEITVNVLQLAQIIEARYIDILRAVFQELSDAGLMDFVPRGVVLAGGGSQIKGMIPFAKRFLGMPVYLTNANKAITAYNGFDDEQKFSYLSSRVQDRVLQTAFGALLYSQSEQFRHSEKSSPEALKVSRMSKMKHGLQNILQRLL